MVWKKLKDEDDFGVMMCWDLMFVFDFVNFVQVGLRYDGICAVQINRFIFFFYVVNFFGLSEEDLRRKREKKNLDNLVYLFSSYFSMGLGEIKMSFFF